MEDKNFQWTESAEARISKVPEGFMRNQTRKRIEEHAASRNSREISLETVEDVIEASRAGMGSMIGGDMSGMPAHVKDMPSKSSKHGTTYFFCLQLCCPCYKTGNLSELRLGRRKIFLA